jgi:hypothetical protein
VTSAGRSIYFFSFWVFFNGVALLLFPEILLWFVGIDGSADIVAQIFGMVLLFLGFYYFMAGRHEGMRDFYRWTTYTRPTTLLFAIFFVVSGQISWLLIPFVLIDVFGALWTHMALREDDASQKSPLDHRA